MEKPEQQPNKPRKTGQLPDLGKLSLPEIEDLISRAQQAEARRHWPSPALDKVLLPEKPEELTSKSAKKRKEQSDRPRPVPKDVSEQRFRPAGLGLEVQPRKARRKRETGPQWRNIIGYTLEGLVILAVLLVVGSWILQQFGISINWLGFWRGSGETSFTPLQADGLLLSASAPGVIMVKATATPEITAAAAVPTTTPIPELTTSAEAITTAAPAPAPVPTSTPAPTLAPAGPTPVIAATPTPMIVQPRPINASGPTVQDNLAAIIARRIVIPKIGLDSPIREVTVDLGTWQVADFAVGHHLGTANPGQTGNMVLAGHRDIRGSVFLRLNELQPGDRFEVFTDSEVFRYVVSEINEVGPTAVEVLNPTIEPTATLITCTPVGFATRRLIIKAKLQI